MTLKVLTGSNCETVETVLDNEFNKSEFMKTHKFNLSKNNLQVCESFMNVLHEFTEIIGKRGERLGGKERKNQSFQ